MVSQGRNRTGSDWWFSKILQTGLDRIQNFQIRIGLADWKISQSAHFWPEVGQRSVLRWTFSFISANWYSSPWAYV